MKLRNLLITTCVPIALTACGDKPEVKANKTSPENDASVAASEQLRGEEQLQWDTAKYTEENKARIKEILIEPISKIRDGISGDMLTDYSKALVKNVWSQLSALGFSGYDPKVLEVSDSQKGKDAFTSETGGVYRSQTNPDIVTGHVDYSDDKLTADGFPPVGFGKEAAEEKKVVRYTFRNDFDRNRLYASSSGGSEVRKTVNGEWVGGSIDASPSELERAGFLEVNLSENYSPEDFHDRLIGILLHDQNIGPFPLTMRYNVQSYTFVPALLGQSYKGKVLSVKQDPSLDKYVDNEKVFGYVYVLENEDGSGRILVTADQLLAWNQVFLNVLKSNQVFKDFMISTNTDLSAGIGTRALRRNEAALDMSGLRINGVQGCSLDTGNYLTGHMSGELNGKAADLKGVMGVKSGSLQVGVAYAYTDQKEGALCKRVQKEGSLVVSKTLDNLFVEGQLGRVSSLEGDIAIEGTRYQFRAGMDLEYVSPFVQFTGRSWETSVKQHTLSGGCELNLQRYRMISEMLSVSANLIGGVQLNTGEFVGDARLQAELDMSSGISFGFSMSPKKSEFSFTVER